MSVLTRRRAPADPQATLVVTAVAVATVAYLVVRGALWLAGWWTGQAQQVPGNPLTLVGDLVRGRIAWTPACTAAAVGLAVTLLAVAGAVAGLVAALRARRPAIDRATRALGRGRQLYPLTVRAARKKARRLGIDGFVGHVIGPTVAGNTPLVSDCEATRVTFAGPRTGWKTTTWAIPQIVDAPGFAVATENKPGLCNHTRDVRAQRGQVWVFDPMHIVGEPCTWFWNPISAIDGPAAAHRYASLYAAAIRPTGAKQDDYFGPEGITLLGNLLLACAVDNRPITDAYGWATRPNEREPVRLLEAAGYLLPAQAVRGVIDAPSKERGGIYGGVRRSLSFLLNDDAAGWITPAGPGDWRREFDPHQFVRGSDTLYLLSREGVASTAPLVLALTVAVCEAAEALADGSPGGRLPVPGTFVLDEAANIVRWPTLPDQYSHYGSKGLLIDTVLQSPAQGAAVWGRDGLDKLVASASVMIYGGGVRDVDWLAKLGQMVGHHNPTQASSTSSRSGYSTSRSQIRELTLDVSDLADLHSSRALVFGYGAPATLVRKVPWWKRRDAAAIRASAAAHDPGAAGADHRPQHAAEQPAQPTLNPAPAVTVDAPATFATHGPADAQLRTDNPWAAL